MRPFERGRIARSEPECHGSWLDGLIAMKGNPFASLALLVLGLTSSGCGSPTQPAVVSLAGTWIGTVTQHFGPNTARVTASSMLALSQSGTSLGGRWQTVLNPYGVINNDSVVNGSISGSAASLTVTSWLADPAAFEVCSFVATLTTTGTRLR
jgi:hypothetical protein